MQFRVQGRSVQCIRSTYDPASKRSHQRVIASIGRWDSNFLKADLSGLTESELDELSAWWEKRQAAMDAALIEHCIKNAASNLSDLARAIKSLPITGDEAGRIYTGIAAVAKELRKAGHAKPRREPSGRPAALPGQRDLLAICDGGGDGDGGAIVRSADPV